MSGEQYSIFGYTIMTAEKLTKLSMGIWRFFVATFLLYMSWANAATAEGKDLCKSGDLLRFEQNGTIYFRIKDFDSVAFRASSSCEIDGLCELTLMSGGLGKSEVIWDKLTVENICHAFVKTRNVGKNPYFGVQSYSGRSVYPKVLFTSYELRVPEGYLSLQDQVFYWDRLPKNWGISDGPGDTSGAILTIQVSDETVLSIAQDPSNSVPPSRRPRSDRSEPLTHIDIEQIFVLRVAGEINREIQRELL